MMLFFKLINSSFKRNLKVYIPYLISMTMLVAINYIFKAVEINRSLKDLPSAAVTKALMQTGSTFIILVTLAFMIYVNRFLWQQRQQEMGLYSMLGMTRHNLQVLTVIEKCYLLVISLFLGTLFGIIFDRLAFLGFAHLLQIDHLSQPWIEWGAVINTIVIIGGFFLILMVIDLINPFMYLSRLSSIIQTASYVVVRVISMLLFLSGALIFSYCSRKKMEKNYL